MISYKTKTLSLEKDMDSKEFPIEKRHKNTNDNTWGQTSCALSEPQRCKGVEKEMASPRQTLSILNEYGKSMLRVCLEYGKSMPRVCLEYGKSMPRVCLEYGKSMPRVCLEYAWSGVHTTKSALRYALMIVVMMIGVTGVWGQDHSGVYYIGSSGYNASKTAENYYLCPTENWYNFQSSTPFYRAYTDETDNGMPFMTTYQCRNGEYDAKNAVWIVEKKGGTDYYYIKHAIDGKYLTFNVAMGNSSNAGRMRLHLEESPADDDALFKITQYSGYYNIETKKSGADNADRKYLNVTDGNKNYLVANGKTDGPKVGGKNIETGGIVGLWTSGTEETSKWYLEKATIDPPTITNNLDGTFTIAAAEGAIIYYTTNGTSPNISTETTGTTSVNVSQTESMSTIKAIAKGTSDYFPTLTTTYEIPKCSRPVITIIDNNVKITCDTEGASIYYTINGNHATSSSTLYEGPFAKGDIITIRAIATRLGYTNSSEAIYSPPITVHSSSEINDMSRIYILASGFTSETSIGTSENPFRGTIDGQMNTLSGLDHALVAYANDATIKNVILDNVNISGGTNTGAICNEATGDTRIYNCGILATNSNVEKDKDGYDFFSSCSSNVSGSGYVGGIVGLLDGRSRVINCFSYANVSGGSYAGGIVGYNNVATTASNLKTMVMNCMFYGEVSGSSIAPIYNGLIITNDGDADGVNNFNYFRLESNYIQNTAITKVYNCALGAETRFLQRFEFFRHLLNSNRELAAWWATGDAANKDEMMKWVMEPTQIRSNTPYPILKTPRRYASMVNYTPDETPYDEDNRNKGRKLGTLSVTISNSKTTGGQTWPSDARITTSSLNLTITDKDFEHFNFNYGKVQLPYYNDVGTQNYTGNRVVTGWKIVSITSSTATTGGYSTGDDITYESDNMITPYNFADRKKYSKDLYTVSGRVFNQGAYWDVPEGVTAITIEPYWGKAVYLADAYWDIVYQNGTGGQQKDAGSQYDAMTTSSYVTTVGGGQRYENGVSTFNDQIVYTSMSNAISSSALFSGGDANKDPVYDYAVVLVGNYHHNGSIEASNSKPYTVTSVDLDGDNEPDYSFILRFNGRTPFHPVRYDFLNIIGLGMAQKTTGGTGSYNLGIMQPKAWFEVTNTALFRVTQFEYSMKDRVKNPYILQGGVIEQWVTQQQDAGDRVSYFHVGGNVWFKEFHRGSHQDNKDKKTPHPPVSVTGGDFDKFYLTGLYQSQAAIYDDNAECYISGGRFGEVAGAGMEGIGTSNGKGNITWIIDHADIKEFYGGGINAAKPVHGNIQTIISNSHVDQFCGGPKFGDMENGRTVTTTATNTTFGTYYGAGYGGNSYNRYAPTNKNDIMNIAWNTWVNTEYTQTYNSTYGGVSTQIDYQFIPMSSNVTNVARLWVEFVKFSLATCRNVTSSLTGCKITGNFYGGGKLGKVDGDVTSTLTNCQVTGSVFGAGYSAALPQVDVMDLGGFTTEPLYYTDLGTYRTGVTPATKKYSWQHGNSISINTEQKILYTTEDLTTLGTVTGKVILNIEGDETNITEKVYGGGESSDVYGVNASSVVTSEVKINVKGGSMTDVYGGGKGKSTVVGGNITVNIGQAPTGDETTYTGNATVTGSVYGGSAFGAVNAKKDANWDEDSNPNALSEVTNTETIVNVFKGTINHDVYGGGLGQVNGVDGATSDVTAKVFGNTIVTIGAAGETANPIVEGSVYGGSNVNGVSKKDVTVQVIRGTIGKSVTTQGENPTTTITGGNVHGGGYGELTLVQGDVIVNIGDVTLGETPTYSGFANILQDVYGGSAKGNVNAEKYEENSTIKLRRHGTATTLVNLYGGTINGNLYGGGLGEDNDGTENDHAANVFGPVTVTTKGGTATNVFGCNNVLGAPQSTVDVNIDGGTVSNDVYGGGNLANTDVSPTVNVTNGTVSQDVYGGGALANTGGSTVNITGGTVTRDIYGGGSCAGQHRCCQWKRQ